MALRFTQRDFLGLREEMIRFMSEKLGDKWNDYSESDETMTLIELLAHCVSNLHFAYDNQKRETDIVTAAFPRNVYAHAIRNGYKPSLFTAGRTWINIDLRKKVNGVATDEFTSLPVSIIIPRYTEIKNDDGDICITNREFILPAGASHFSIEVLGGQYAYEQFTRADINEFNYFVLGRLNVSSDSTRLFYQNEEWTPVTDVFTDVRTSKIYSLEPNFVRQGVRNIIRFFTNWADEIIDTSKITVEYIQTNGARSNYEKDTFTSYLNKGDYSKNTVSFNEDVYDSAGNKISSWNDVDFSFTQSKPFANGQNYESIDVIKKSYLQSIRQTTSLVVLEDYEAFLTLNGVKDFYVTDWDRNKTETITIEYPRDIKALKAKEDAEEHDIFSPLNTTTEPYWQSNVSNINASDNITETRKIDGREIIIFKSFDVNIADFSEYKDDHWYEEWVQATKIKSKLETNSSLINSIFLASPFRQYNTTKTIEVDGIDTEVPVFSGNYDDNISFMDVRSKLRVISDSLIDTGGDAKELNSRVMCTNKNPSDTINPPYLNIRYFDLDESAILERYTTPNRDILFSSYYLKNSITSVLFDTPPAFFDQTTIVNTNIADISFRLKNDIYSEKFLEDIKQIYPKFESNIINNETVIKNSINNKVKSISIKIEGIDTPFIVPSGMFNDTFFIIDGKDITKDTSDVEYDFKHGLTSNTNDVYSTVGYYSTYEEPIESYLIDTHEDDSNGMPILFLKKDGNEIQMTSKIGLCFRKKAIDLHPAFDTTLGTIKPEYSSTESKYNISGERYLEYRDGTKTWITIPVLSDLSDSDLKETTAYQLRRISPAVYLNKLDQATEDEYYNPEKNAYKVFYTEDNSGSSLITVKDNLYHDDFFFDSDQLTSKPLNLHYIYALLNQPSNLYKDNSDVFYIEEYTASNCYGYKYDPSAEPPVPFEKITPFDNEDKYGFLRTASHLVGKHNYDYSSKPFNVDGDSCLTNLQDIENHINNSILLEIQETFPKYLKYLILQVCFVYEASYLMSHSDLNKYLVNLGVENIRYALEKILSATFSISYWYSDSDAVLGKQYTYSPNENKRYIACGGDSSWDETMSPACNYFRWDIVYPELVDLYKKIQQKQGRGDAVYILPYIRNGLDIHAHVYIEQTVSDIAGVFEKIWNSLANLVGILTNIEEVHYVSEFISAIQTADSSILKVCTVGEVDFSGSYAVSIPDSSESMFITDTSASSLKPDEFNRFLKFSPEDEVKPESDLGHALVLGNVCIRIQKNSKLDNIIYHFERSGLNLSKTLAYKLKEVN